MAITIHASFLPYDDPDACLAFHRDILGFEVRRDTGYDGPHWIAVGPPGQPGTSIALESPVADLGVTDDERRTVAKMMAKGTYSTSYCPPPTSTASSRGCRPAVPRSSTGRPSNWTAYATAPSAIPRAT